MVRVGGKSLNILDYLNKKQPRKQDGLHPFHRASSSFKYIYCYGIGILAFGYKNSSSDTITIFKELLSKIQLNDVNHEKLISSIKTNFDFKLQDVFRTIRKKEEQYCFIGDLFYITNHSQLSPTYTQDIIEGYMQVFGLHSIEKEFLKSFCLYAASEEKNAEPNKNALQNKLISSYYKLYDTVVEKSENKFISLARILYQNFLEQGYFISYKMAIYLFPNFTLEESFHSISIDQGKTLTLDYPAYLYGTTVLKNCSTLIVENITLHINGNILIESGKLFIKNSDIIIDDCMEDFAILVKETTSIVIENSTINCNYKSAFLSQENGYLSFINSKIRNTTKDRALKFSGHSVTIENCSFENCLDGGILNHATNHMLVEHCSFLNCHAEHGGGIYSKSLYQVNINSCDFSSCRANYLGCGIYFVNKKYGQQVLDCHFHDCSPSDSLVFNEYNDIHSLYTTKK